MGTAERGEPHRRFELRFDGPDQGNPFLDVELVAEFSGPDGILRTVGGFYDGGGQFAVRLLPEVLGEWTYRTRSNVQALDGVTGDFTIEPGSGHGRVEVAEQFHFRHVDGARYSPLGTTAYVWNHQPEALRSGTLETLRDSPFNKVRFCVFPKSYLYNSEEPELFPFPRREDGSWDTTRFDLAFFQGLDRRVEELDDAGIQADLILFHPYDRWGFSDLGADADDRYVQNVVRRLAGQPNIWWSMANEFDFVATKSIDDWERLAAVVRREDHANHLLSIHNGLELYDQAQPWITHASVQRVDLYRTVEDTDAWRARWGKPVVLDEVGYEGDLDQAWGNLTAQELVRRCWEGAVRGGYGQHGETYFSTDEVIWWSKGGVLRGESPPRLAFLAQLVAEAPEGVIDPLPSDWDVPWGGVADRYILIYLGAGQSRFRTVKAPEGIAFHVDIIDTWNMTIERLDGPRQGTFRVELPGSQYTAIRLVATQATSPR